MMKPELREDGQRRSEGGTTALDDERIKALRALDVVWARREAPAASSDEVLLVALHKARYRCRQIQDDLRHESAAWLRAHGFGDLHGEPLLPPGELP